MVKKEVFEWIRTGQKTNELRRGRAKEEFLLTLKSSILF